MGHLVVLVVHGALLDLPWSLLRLVSGFGPGPKVGVVGLDLELRPDLLPVGASPGVLFTSWLLLR